MIARLQTNNQLLMKKVLLPMLALGLATGASAQVYVAEEMPLSNMSGVTNEGLGVGYNQKNEPFYLWNPMENTFKEIGGISPGDGVGGTARFDNSGLKLTAPYDCKAIPVKTDWVKNVYEELAPYRFNQLSAYSEFDIWAVGSGPDGHGAIFRSLTGGVSWKRSDSYTVERPDGSLEPVSPEFEVLCFAPITMYELLAGGTDGMLLVGKNTGSWDILPCPVENIDVKTYTAMDFKYAYNDYKEPSALTGCIAVELADGSGAILYTVDGGESFSLASGIDFVPVSLAHNDSYYFAASEDGSIAVSWDNGKNWTRTFKAYNDHKLYRIVFGDSSHGVALSDDVVYITTNGGNEWREVPTGVTTRWNDAAWHDGTLTIVGEAGAYQTADNGATFTKIDAIGEGLTAIVYSVTDACIIMGKEGTVYTKENKSSFEGYTAAIYDLETETWTPLNSTGLAVDKCTSAPWAFSGDGEHVAGLSYGFDPKVGLVTEYAAVWDGTDKLTLLPNRFVKKGKPCRANAISYDGSVIVGWQDVFGPWFGSIWRKGADGQYTQQLMTTGDLSQDDIDYTNWDQCYANLAGYAQCISDDGKWIGGRGQSDIYGMPGAWIWSEETGFIKITDETGNTTCINNDGTLALGWEFTSGNGWIWTKEGGRVPIQEYAIKTLGADTGEYILCGVYDLSPNGRYVTGFAYKGLDAHGYILDLMGGNGIEQRMADQVKAAVYPNPVADELHVDLPFDSSEVASTVALYDMQGKTVARLDHPKQSNVIDVRSLSKGIYVLSVRSASSSRTFKVIVK